MVLSVGTDIVEIARIRRAMQNPRFLARILTIREREISTDPQFVAGRWAAKEAISKCLPSVSRWQDVEVLKGKHGEPVVKLAPSVADDTLRIHVSISHERSLAVAFAVVESLTAS